MQDLTDWLGCPECGPGSDLVVEEWSYGFRAECDCGEVLFWES